MIIPVINLKGGTGKTTTVANLGRGLVMEGKNVLLIDLDPQSNLSFCLGIKPSVSITGEIIAKGKVEKEDISIVNDLHLIANTPDLINFEVEFIRQNFPYTSLKTALEGVKDDYDYILIDCPPAGSFLTVNALIAADAVLIPMQMDVLSLQGLEQIIDRIFEIKQEYNPSLYVLGVLGVMVDNRRQLTHEILEKIRNDYGLSIFNNYVRNNVRAAEAPSFGKTVIEYAPQSNSAIDYLSVTKEFLYITKN